MANKSRKILCFFISAFFAIGLGMFILSNLANYTLCSNGYMKLFLNDSDITAYCDSIYNERLEALSRESNVPVQAFGDINKIKEYAPSQTALFFSEETASLYNQARINDYENHIIDFLNKNDISYKKSSIHALALKATEIFAESYGVNNIQPLKDFVDEVNQNYAKYGSIGLVSALALVALMFTMFRDKRKAKGYISRSFTSTGIFMVIISAGSLILGIGRISGITPLPYAQAISHAIIGMNLIGLLIGVIIIVGSIPFSRKYFKLSRTIEYF